MALQKNIVTLWIGEERYCSFGIDSRVEAVKLALEQKLA